MGKLSCKAEITVFLSLILSVVLWCSLILIEGVRIVNLDYMAQSMIEAGTFSLLGDYNRILLDKYDVFFLDASYNSAQLSETKIKEKLNEYINYNNSSLFNNNILKQNLEEVLVENMGVITEDCGKLFRKQAINSTDQNIGMNIGLLPITGITLPFVSYGGSSLISYMIIFGIILNIANKK